MVGHNELDIEITPYSGEKEVLLGKPGSNVFTGRVR